MAGDRFISFKPLIVRYATLLTSEISVYSERQVESSPETPAAQENGNHWRALLGREVALARNRYGYRVNGHYLRRVTTLLGGIPKPALTGWAAKTVAEFAVEHKDSWLNLPKTDAVKLLRARRGPCGTTRRTAGARFTRPSRHTWRAGRCRTGSPRTSSTAPSRSRRSFASTSRKCSRWSSRSSRSRTSTRAPWTCGALGRDGHTYILDWKTSGGVYTDHAVQLAAYANAKYAVANKRPTGPADKEAWDGTLIEWGPAKAQRLGIVHVRPDGVTLHPVNYTSRLWHVFRAAAFTKLWQLDTDSYNRTPRESVFGDPIDVSPRSPQASTAAA